MQSTISDEPTAMILFRTNFKYISLSMEKVRNIVHINFKISTFIDLSLRDMQNYQGLC